MKQIFLRVSRHWRLLGFPPLMAFAAEIDGRGYHLGSTHSVFMMTQIGILYLLLLLRYFR